MTSLFFHGDKTTMSSCALGAAYTAVYKEKYNCPDKDINYCIVHPISAEITTVSNSCL